jgi:mannitol PTS system EIIA component
MDDTTTALLHDDAIVLGAVASSWEDAVRQVGAALVQAGAVTPAYVELMLERERSVSTFVGEGVAIPHGTLAGRDAVLRDALAVVQFPDGVDWHGDDVRLCIGIAACGESHLPILAQLGEILMDEDRAAGLRAATSADDVRILLTDDSDPDDAHEDD